MSRHLKELDAHLRNGRDAEAAALCAQLTARRPESVSLHLTLSQVYQRLGDFTAMLESARAASTLEPRHIGAQMRSVECLIYCCQVGAALTILETLERDAVDDPRLLQDVAQMYLQCAGHAQAGRCHERAVQLEPGNPKYLYNLASSCIALGEIQRAEELFNQVIAIDPADFGAYLNRSMLRTWTADNHHLAELTQLLQRLPSDNTGEVPLCYALAKEYEDLGESHQSFAFIQRGAARRRGMLAYKVDNDVAAMARIRHTFDRPLLSKSAPAKAAWPNEPSYFVLGLPRSGTTLVDRILSSHSQVSSLGEINDFAFALMQLASGPGGKLGMIDRSAHIDFSRLGQIYRDGIGGYGVSAPFLINKAPANYLYLGLIRLALPGAKVIHLRRHPLDSCHAMYKTLFRMGYPFSYSLEDLGHYYLAYHQLLEHWRTVIPDSFIDVDYETLVDAQEQTTRGMLDYCELPWEQGCLEFHRNESPSATASAAQVRRPMYRNSVQRWRQYAQQLAPLASFLSDHGIDCG